MNNVSFKSRINFVNRVDYEKIKTGICIDYKTQEELNKINILKCIRKPFNSEKRTPRLDIVQSEDVFTEEVRTCTAGGVVDTKTGKCVGFHIYDGFYNNEMVDEILENIFDFIQNPDRALLIGSKKLKNSIYSVPIFQKIYDGISERIENVTIFREHVFPFSESNIHHSSKNDTWTIQSMYRPLFHYKDADIESKDDLYKCFKEIKIANGDVVEFK